MVSPAPWPQKVCMRPRVWFGSLGNCSRSQIVTCAAGSLHAVLEAPSQIPGLAEDGPVAQESAASSSKAINWYQQWCVGRCVQTMPV